MPVEDAAKRKNMVLTLLAIADGAKNYWKICSKHHSGEPSGI